jgi:hypothetical protein
LTAIFLIAQAAFAAKKKMTLFRMNLAENVSCWLRPVSSVLHQKIVKACVKESGSPKIDYTVMQSNIQILGLPNFTGVP